MPTTHVPHPIVFFAHVHPHRFIIHEPSFTTNYSLNRAPPYLVNAVCALAAPFCRHPVLPVSRPRYSGQPFAEAAYGQMFDGDGQLTAPLCLESAQALYFLQLHMVISLRSVNISFRYFGTSLVILSHCPVSLQYLNFDFDRTCFTDPAIPRGSES